MVLRIALPRSRVKILFQSAQQCGYATVVATPPSHSRAGPIQLHTPTQPPSYRPPELRKSQLHRQYTSLLRSTPLMLVLQHNNLKASEWAGIRRELALALKKTAPKPAEGDTTPAAAMPDPSETVNIQIIQTGIFSAALRVTEFFRPTSADGADTTEHALSEAAYKAARPSKRSLRKAGLRGRAAKHIKKSTPLHRLLKGPIAVLTFPSVSPPQLATALKIVAPTQGSGSAFPAPRRKDAPGYYEPAVQAGLQKLLLLGARVDGKVVDQVGVRHVGGLPGLEGLRAQLVGVLSSAGMGLTSALESASRSVWFNLEARRMDMEEQGKPREEAVIEAKGEATGEEVKA